MLRPSRLQSWLLLACVLFLSIVCVYAATERRETAGDAGVLAPLTHHQQPSSIRSLSKVFARASSKVLADLERNLDANEFAAGVASIRSRINAAAAAASTNAESSGQQKSDLAFQTTRFALIEEWKDSLAPSHSFLQATSTLESQGRSALMHSMRANLAAHAREPWYAEVAFAPGARSFKEFTLDPQSILDKAKEWINMDWEKAKKDKDPMVILRFNEFRALYVRAIAALVQQSGSTCTNCIVRGSGSSDPASDIDLSISGWNTNRFIRAWHALFQKHWPTHQTSAHVFDVNLYADAWIWPMKGYTNLIDENSRDPAKKIDLLIDQSQRKIPLCYSIAQVNNEDAYVFSVSPSQSAADEASQRSWSFVHMLVYKMEQATKGLNPPIHCNYGVDAAQLSTLCPLIADMFINTRITDRVIQAPYRAELNQAIVILLDLVQSPCKELSSPVNAFCIKPPPSNRGFVPYLNMHSIEGRNLMHFNALDQFYTAVDPVLSAKPFSLDPEYCLKTKNIVSRAAFYSQEAYLAKGTINHIVHAGQSSAQIHWITRGEFFHSFIENLADFQKDFAHLPSPLYLPQTATESDRQEFGRNFLTKTSKYLTRVFRGHHRAMLSTKSTDSKRLALSITPEALQFQNCMFSPVFTLQKNVRNKLKTTQRTDAIKCAENVVKQCIQAYMGGSVRTVIDPIDLSNAIQRYGSEVIAMYYNTNQPGEQGNNQEGRLHHTLKSYQHQCWTFDRNPANDTD